MSQSDVTPCPRCGAPTIVVSFPPRSKRDPIVTDAYQTDRYIGADLVVRSGWRVHEGCEPQIDEPDPGL